MNITFDLDNNPICFSGFKFRLNNKDSKYYPINFSVEYSLNDKQWIPLNEYYNYSNSNVLEWEGGQSKGSYTKEQIISLADYRVKKVRLVFHKPQNLVNNGNWSVHLADIQFNVRPSEF